ncbi:hypothetical protein EDC01DRAFT_173311 [Geopyxis carbonaria]|nr:hypothetical protein EDC01DRAFT_173311 [Geopyxis carbonaria]
MSTLPSTRHLLSALISQIAASTAEVDGGAGAGLPRELMVSLHCLLPNMLLPALDLLDRGCVVRWVLEPAKEASAEEEAPTGKEGKGDAEDAEGQAVGAVKLESTTEKAEEREEREEGDQAGEAMDTDPPAADAGIKPEHPPSPAPSPPSPHPSLHPPPPAASPLPPPPPPPPEAPVYYIPSHPPPPPSAPKSGPRFPTRLPPSYEVRPAPWSCTCAAFIFSAINTLTVSPVSPVSPPASSPPETRAGAGAGAEAGSGSEIGRGTAHSIWGGASIGAVPVCKHLLAAVLAEHCGGVFEALVQTRYGSREEMAGLAVVWD